MDIETQVKGCFGVADKIFAGHPADEERAFRLLERLRRDGKGWKETRQLLSDYLNSVVSDSRHISEQLERARKRLKPWLID